MTPHPSVNVLFVDPSLSPSADAKLVDPHHHSIVKSSVKRIKNIFSIITHDYDILLKRLLDIADKYMELS